MLSVREVRVEKRNALRREEDLKKMAIDLAENQALEDERTRIEKEKNEELLKSRNLEAAINYLNTKNVGSLAHSNFHGINAASKQFNISKSTLRDNYKKYRQEPIDDVIEEKVSDKELFFINSVDKCLQTGEKPCLFWRKNKEILKCNNFGRKKFTNAVKRRQEDPPGPYFAKIGRHDCIPESLIQHIKSNNLKDLTGNFM